MQESNETDQSLDAFEITVKKNTADPRVKEVDAKNVNNISKISKISDDFGVPEESAESSKISMNEKKQYTKLRGVASFLNLNYDSPNIHDIRKQQRLQEIEQISKRVESNVLHFEGSQNQNQKVPRNSSENQKLLPKSV